MSRRASLLLAKAQRQDKPRIRSVRFSDELVLQDNVKENDMPALLTMLRRNSLQVDINTINTAGLSALHQAVLDDNLAAVKLLLNHDANVNLLDEDTWTPLHAACANGFSNIARYLLRKGADPHITNEDGERPIDLADPTDFETISVMLQHMQTVQKNEENTDVNGETDDAEIEERVSSVAEDSNTEDDRLPESVDNVVQARGVAKIERLSSKYLDSDDDNLEYVSEDDDDDDDEVVFRRRSPERDTCSVSSAKKSVGSDTNSVSSDIHSGGNDRRRSSGRSVNSDSYSSGASIAECDDYIDRDKRQEEDVASDVGIKQCRSDSDYICSRTSSIEYDKASDVSDSDAHASSWRYLRSPDSGQYETSPEKTLSRETRNDDSDSDAENCDVVKYSMAKYDTDSERDASAVEYADESGETDGKNNYCRGMIHDTSDADGYTGSS